MRQFELHSILNYHDEIVVFIANDKFENLFVFSIYDEHCTGASSYLGFELSVSQYIALISGKLDLRQAYLSSIDSIYYEVYFDENGSIIVYKTKEIVEDADLPESGIYFDNVKGDNFVR